MVFAKKLLLQNKQNEDKTLGQMLEEAEGSQELWILAEGAQTGECCLPGILPSSAECPPPGLGFGLYTWAGGAVLGCHSHTIWSLPPCANQHS